MVTYKIKTIKKGKIYQVIVKNIKKTEGKYNGNILLDSNYPEKPKVPIRFVGIISGNLELRPNGLYFGKLQKIENHSIKGLPELATRYQKTIYLTLNKGAGLKVEKIEKNEDLFETVIKEVTPGKSYLINVKVKPDKLKHGNLREEMKIHTNLPNAQVRRVPIHIQVSADNTIQRKKLENDRN
jgi:hypothetical protein